eukprot:TRINITY_DN7505_c0_g1_i1.p1 TRINITY_DN7505_c0_g1~~TRINITY_DN7505_c0_g1_i1.p1  ORF type:complete len:898 (-),score=185.69 TRINITY_DN7505_c0_g1_i1:55-2424(-)
MVTLQLGGELAAGTTAVLRLRFTALLGDNMCGFYRAAHNNTMDESVPPEMRYMAVTQFEPADARRAFPCWDEPSLKATFEITLIVPQHCTALSNMPALAETPLAGGKRQVSFAPTPKMSTYLVAFAVGNFDYLEATTAEGVLVRVYTPTGKAQQGRFALTMAANTLHYYIEYYGVPYPLQKLDLIAVPDFAAGAMENWGLVTFRENALLIEEGISSVLSRKRVAYVVGHELAHQWFGNLVTMRWWSDLWLNEGFATFVGTQAVDHFFPHWDTWTEFVASELSRALELDALQSTHPIAVAVSSPAQIGEIFDAISYAKGASVIRMLADYLGEDALRRGLRLYLDRFAYANAETEDLWRALSEVSGADVASAMADWVNRPGYPVVSVSLSAATTVEWSQWRMRHLCEKDQEQQEERWWVPLRVATAGGCAAPPISTLDAGVGALRTPFECDSWLKANSGQVGVYRVLYDDALQARLQQALSRGEVACAADRVGLASDAFALALAGFQRTSRALDLSLALATAGEQNYAVWSELVADIADFARVWRQGPTHERVLAFERSLLLPAAQKLGWEAEPSRGTDGDLAANLRALLLLALVQSGDSAAASEGLIRFTLIEEQQQVAADLWPAVFSAAARAPGGLARLQAVFRRASLQEQRTAVLAAMGSLPDPSVCRQALEWACHSGEVRKQDVYIVAHSASRHSPEVAWAWLRDDWAWLSGNFADSLTLLGRMVQSVLEPLATETQLCDAETFFAAHVAPPRTVQQGLETIRANIAWLARDRDDVARWLASHQKAE